MRKSQPLTIAVRSLKTAERTLQNLRSHASCLRRWPAASVICFLVPRRGSRSEQVLFLPVTINPEGRPIYFNNAPPSKHPWTRDRRPAFRRHGLQASPQPPPPASRCTTSTTSAQIDLNPRNLHLVHPFK